MTDQPAGTPLSEEKIAELLAEETPVSERAEPLIKAAWQMHGLLTPEGALDDSKVEDLLYKLALTAEVSTRDERKTTAITRTNLTRAVVPHMPGPGDYDEQPDPEAAEYAWSTINTAVWRMLDHNSDGRVQQRLNGEHNLLLCRTKATAEKGVEGVYVTRNWACIQADFVKPDQTRVERAIERMSNNAEMGAERIPELGKKFRRELNDTTKQALTSGLSKVDRQIEAGTNGEEASPEDDSPEVDE